MLNNNNNQLNSFLNSESNLKDQYLNNISLSNSSTLNNTLNTQNNINITISYLFLVSDPTTISMKTNSASLCFPFL